LSFELPRAQLGPHGCHHTRAGSLRRSPKSLVPVAVFHRPSREGHRSGQSPPRREIATVCPARRENLESHAAVRDKSRAKRLPRPGNDPHRGVEPNGPLRRLGGRGIDANERTAQRPLRAPSGASLGACKRPPARGGAPPSGLVHLPIGPHHSDTPPKRRCQDRATPMPPPTPAQATRAPSPP